MRVRASSRPEILQAGAVKGLMLVPLLTTYTPVQGYLGYYTPVQGYLGYYTPVQGYLGYSSRSASFSVPRSLWSVSSK